MSFTLRIKFSGLVLLVIHPEERKAMALLPYCRPGVDRKHADHELLPEEERKLGEFHVGYLRFDRSNLSPNGERAAADRLMRLPSWELIHRVGRGQMLLPPGAPDGQPFDTGELEIAELCSDVKGAKPIAKYLQVNPALLGAAPPQNDSKHLLFRVPLVGGKIEANGTERTWEIAEHLNPELTKPLEGDFAGSFVWSCRYPGDSLVLRPEGIPQADSPEPPSELTLYPHEGVIDVWVSNLCRDNPLEWEEFEKRDVKVDIDFKWMYRLLTPKPDEHGNVKPLKQQLMDCSDPKKRYLPHPRRGPTNPRGDQGCSTAKATQSY